MYLPEVAWRPFQLNSEAPLEGVSKKKMYEERFGVERTRMMSETLGGEILYVYVMDRYYYHPIVVHEEESFMIGEKPTSLCNLITLSSTT